MNIVDIAEERGVDLTQYRSATLHVHDELQNEDDGQERKVTAILKFGEYPNEFEYIYASKAYARRTDIHFYKTMAEEWNGDPEGNWKGYLEVQIEASIASREQDIENAQRVLKVSRKSIKGLKNRLTDIRNLC